MLRQAVAAAFSGSAKSIPREAAGGNAPVSAKRRIASPQRRSDHAFKKVSGGYRALSENGKKHLGGPGKSKTAAEKLLKQVESFKRKG